MRDKTTDKSEPWAGVSSDEMIIKRLQHIEDMLAAVMQTMATALEKEITGASGKADMRELLNLLYGLENDLCDARPDRALEKIRGTLKMFQDSLK